MNVRDLWSSQYMLADTAAVSKSAQPSFNTPMRSCDGCSRLRKDPRDRSGRTHLTPQLLFCRTVWHFRTQGTCAQGTHGVAALLVLALVELAVAGGGRPVPHVGFMTAIQGRHVRPFFSAVTSRRMSMPRSPHEDFAHKIRSIDHPCMHFDSTALHQTRLCEYF